MALADSVRHNQEASRFEVEAHGDTAHSDYRRSGETVIFTHTEVPQSMEGQGVGSALAKAGLDWARENGLRVVPRCPFISKWIERHAEYADLVSHR